MTRLFFALVMLAAAAPLAAIERTSAEASRLRQTSTLDQVSVKPLLLFGMRERQDPFMAYALVTVTASTEHFNIANITFSGLVQVQDMPVALFKDNGGQTYTLKGTQLHGPDNQRMAGVRGRVTAEKDVLLEQGERKIVFSTKTTSKRLEDGRSR